MQKTETHDLTPREIERGLFRAQDKINQLVSAVNEMRLEVAELRDKYSEALCEIAHADEQLKEIRMQVWGQPFYPSKPVDAADDDDAWFAQMNEELIKFELNRVGDDHAIS